MKAVKLADCKEIDVNRDCKGTTALKMMREKARKEDLKSISTEAGYSAEERLHCCIVLLELDERIEKDTPLLEDLQSLYKLCSEVKFFK